MQCAKFEQRLQQLMDHREDASQDEALCKHAETCLDCQSLLQAQRALLTGLQYLPKSNSTDLGVRVIDEIVVDERRRRKRRITWFALAIAAILFIALLPLAGSYNPQRNGKQTVGRGLAMAIQSNDDTTTRELTEEEEAELRLLMRQLVMRLSDPQLEMLDSVDQLASGIRPLAATFSYAIDTLRRTLPGYSSQHEPIESQTQYREAA